MHAAARKKKCFPMTSAAVQKRPVNRLTALLIVTALWAAIFLPGLGSTELKGEEGRRIMPAVTMLDGGSWMVPSVGGKPFLRKPPLVQWCMVGTMKVFGRNAWGARLPSVLSVLALAAVMILCTRGWLIPEQSLFAAVVMMTQVATIEKCRLAELEAVYVALSGIAMILWMSWWAQGRSPWLVWTVPFVFNGLAILAKAPLHLLFFYAVVVATLISARELRKLRSLPHFAGLLIMVAVVAAWAVPYFREVAAGDAGQVWKRQFVERVTGAEMDWVKWLLNIPNGLANHLPWVLLAPLLWWRGATDGLHDRTAMLVRGARWAVGICFIGLLLIPGVLPRYVQPLVAPFSLLLAIVAWECPQRFRQWWRWMLFTFTIVVFAGALAAPFVVAAAVTRGAEAMNPLVAGLCVLLVFFAALLLLSLRRRLHETLHLGLWTGLIIAMAILLYATCAVPWMRLKEDIRPFARRIDAALPTDIPLVAYGLDDYAPLLGTLFYLKETPFTYAPDADAAPDGDHFYLVRGRDMKKFRNRFVVFGAPVASWQPDGEKEPSVVVRAQRQAR
jgi:4-amino-4-deoxy-L-arabinose transferase-like glycosyltransferase